MRAFLLPFLLLFLTAAATPAELSRWKAQADRVTITRDDWGIAHVNGPTDADAVFGMIYAQAEDDFPRIEANYLTALGRTAEAEGEKAIWKDLRARLYVSEEKLKTDYARSPDWLKRLMDSWAAGLNHFLATRPDVKPRVLTRFEPWMALSFTEGSIGGDIERIDMGELERFYSTHGHAELDSASMNSAQASCRARCSWTPDQVRGDELALERQNSNGIAIAPKLTAPGTGTLLLINPHTSFFFRSELQMTSGEGLNAYGAVTWGQFFIYQGFNQNVGWMHTSSGVDSVDEFSVDISSFDDRLAYRVGTDWRPMEQRPVTIRYRKADGTLGQRIFTTYHTHHGPIVRRDDNGRWVAFAMMDRPVEALQQSYLRTKATDLASFLKVAELKANSSNNTIFASSKGEIAYLHVQFVPRRDARFDFTKEVDGSDPRTDWGELHALDELPSTVNPPNGWVQNTNSWPYRAAGPNSPKPANFPRYMDIFGENFRERHALGLLEGSSGWTSDKLNAAAYDSYQPGFAALIPPLVIAFDALPTGDPRRPRLAGPIAAMRAWDFRWGARSVPQTLAILWGKILFEGLDADPAEPTNKKYMRLARDTSADRKLDALVEAVDRLSRDFGRWDVPWGEINRFQRISGDIDHPFSDSAPSIPISYADGNFGSLAAFRSGPQDGSKRWYQIHGNTFVAVVEFGERVRARAIREGGESGDPSSAHFNDQAPRYAAGALRTVYFHSDQLEGHKERVYRPGE